MSKFIITGGQKLSGEIQVQGSKNAMFPLFAASLLTDEDCQFTNVPAIKDKEVFLDLLRDLGAAVQADKHTVTINAKNLSKSKIDPTLAGKLRGSIVLLGALLGRMKRASMGFPGGDLIGKRPIDSHLAAFEHLGATVTTNGKIELQAPQLAGAKIVLEESSVTATENTILAAVLAAGETSIKLAAMEPHVQQLCEFLNLMGARISGIGTTTIEISGVEKLHGASIEIIPDSNEAASLITLAAATKSEIRVSHMNPEFMDDFLLKLSQMGVNLEIGRNFVYVHAPTADYVGAKLQCGLYPKLASDDVPTLAVLASQARGESIIHEWMYENRQGYVAELKKMGANAEVLDTHRVKITGPTPLKCAKITSYDIRMGMTMVIAALVATGESEIDGIEHIDRGYEKIEDRLNQLGARIKRIE